jgi:hypothetical protein
MVYAGMMSCSSTIASRVYRALPATWKQYWMYKSFVGETMEMLKNGTSAEAAEKTLWLRYAAEFAEGYKEENEFIRNKDAGHKYTVKKKIKYRFTKYMGQDKGRKVQIAGFVACIVSPCPLNAYSRVG